jgi:hypothetical protein
MGALLALEALYMMTLVFYSLYHALKVLYVASLFSTSILFLFFFYFILFCVPLSLLYVELASIWLTHGIDLHLLL